MPVPVSASKCSLKAELQGEEVRTSVVTTETNKRESSALPALTQSDDDRETWDKKAEFLLAVIGFAVDLGNVWRFPFICYRNGGGAFLVPYVIMLIFGGLPLFYLELALGQYYKSGCITIWDKLCPMMKGIGCAICFIDLYMGMYYNTIIAWAFYYLFASFTSELPWTKCDNAWNTPHCLTLAERSLNASNESVSPAQEYFERSVLEIHKADGIDGIGPIKWTLSLCLMAVFILVYFSLWKGVKSSGKVVWFTATMPYVVLFILLCRGVTLEGSMDGIKYYLYPKWEKLLESEVWIDAATQIFFSLGPGFGTLLALSSYNKFHNNCYRDAIFTSTVNCLTSFLAGFVIFSVLGYMAHMLKKDIETVATDGPGLVFVVYPEAVATMKGSVFWSILFFLMLITLGLDSTFGGLEAMITGLCDQFPTHLRRNRELFVGAVVIFIYFCALPTCTYGGYYVVNLLDSYGTSMSVLFIVFVEAAAVCWLYGAERFSDQVKEMLGFKPGIFWRVCWKYISPIFILSIYICAMVKYKDLTIRDYEYPKWSIGVGWCLTASSLLCIPGYIIYFFLSTPGTCLERIRKGLNPSTDTQRTQERIPINFKFLNFKFLQNSQILTSNFSSDE
ncbi:sodium-dependent serotonin transporter [Parasteatoda tepidariorum]|uniref:sodium-dependent serotonin transporter n=1 Tax=Parasteatoda tepidariorum TaxID=114398 RepID=UPI000A2C0BF7|nr:sodium-dependent serotonin transporter [Parasteatoda tepidariorum]